ncbi:flavoprotein [Actinokineospora sp.]|uniref:flavoprotein n=1 Tax=Actinokineospora sp. TaxID=1872133 RepID=UPI003D6AC96B
MKVAYVVVSAAPPALHVGTLIDSLHDSGWNVCLAATPTAASWLDVGTLSRHAGNPLRHDFRAVEWPLADAIIAAPATFNTINKWAAGISDSFALGVLNESIGLGVRTVACPYAKPTLAAHPAFGRSLRSLESWGVEVLPNEAIRSSWTPVLEALDR